MNTWLPSLAIALVSAVLGLVGTGVLGSACVRWYRISSFEGGSGFFVIFLALGGGLAGGLTGLMVARGLVEDGVLPVGRAFGIATATVACLLAAGAALARLSADIPPTVRGRPVRLEVEFRLPAGATPPSPSPEARMHLGSVVGGVQRASRPGVLRLADARSEAGRWVVPGEVELFTRRGQATVSVAPSLGEPAGFMVPLPGDPAQALDRWSGWLPSPRPGDAPWPDDKVSYRFRLRVAGGEAR